MAKGNVNLSSSSLSILPVTRDNKEIYINNVDDFDSGYIARRRRNFNRNRIEMTLGSVASSIQFSNTKNVQ